MDAPIATVVGGVGRQTKLLIKPASTLGTQVAATAVPGPALVQVSVAPATTCPGASTGGRPPNTGDMSETGRGWVTVQVPLQLGGLSPPPPVPVTALATLPDAEALTVAVYSTV